MPATVQSPDLTTGLDYSIRAMDPRSVLESPALTHWLNIFQRCYNPKHPHYRWYGARGIGIAERWMNPLNFIADVGEKPPGLSLDRIDNEGHYAPGNCRWATQEEQNENTRRTKLVTYRGKTQSIKHWAKEYNISPPRLSERLRRGWTMERALSTPCPRGFERGREMHIAEAKRQWSMKGRAYLRNSRNKAKGIAPGPANCVKACAQPLAKDSMPDAASRRRNAKVDDQAKLKISILAAQGKSCRAIAAEVGVSKSSVSLFLAEIRSTSKNEPAPSFLQSLSRP